MARAKRSWDVAPIVREHSRLKAATSAASLETEVPEPVVKLVEKAAEFCGQGKLDAALGALVDAWAKHPVIEIADRVEHLGTSRVSKEARDALELEKVSEELWNTFFEADRIGDRAALIEMMLKTSIRSMCARAPRVAELPADPRITRTFTGWLRDMPFRALSSRAMWTAMFDYLAAHPDPETHSIARTIAESELPCGATMQKWMQGRLSQLLAIDVPALGTNPALREALGVLDDALTNAIGDSGTPRPKLAPVDAEPARPARAELAHVHSIGAAAAAETQPSPGGQLIATRLEPTGGWRQKRDTIISLVDAKTGAFRYAVEANVIYAVSHDATLIAYALDDDLIVEDMSSGKERLRVRLHEPDPTSKTPNRLGVVRGIVFDRDDSRVLVLALRSTTRVNYALCPDLLSVDAETGDIEALMTLQMGQDAYVVARWLDDDILSLEGASSWVLNVRTLFVHQAFRSIRGAVQRGRFGRPFCLGPRVAEHDHDKKLSVCDAKTMYPELEVQLDLYPQAVYESDRGLDVLVQDRSPTGHSTGPPMLIRIREGSVSEPVELGIDTKSCRSLGFDHDGRVLAGDAFGEVHVFDVSEEVPKKTTVLQPSGSSVQGVASFEGGAFAWNLAVLLFLDDRKLSLTERDSIGSALIYGERLYMSVTSGLYSRGLGKKKRPLTFEKGHTYDVTALACGSTGTLASTSHDNAVISWSLEGKIIHRHAGHTEPSLDVTFHPGGEIFATVGQDRTLRLWDASSADARAVFELEAEPRNVAWSRDGRTIAWTSADGVHLMSPDGSDQRLAPLVDVHAIAAHPTRSVFAIGAGKSVHLVGEGSCVLSEGHSVTVRSLAFSPDGDRLYVSAGKNTHPGALTELALEWGTG